MLQWVREEFSWKWMLEILLENKFWNTAHCVMEARWEVVSVGLNSLCTVWVIWWFGSIVPQPYWGTMIKANFLRQPLVTGRLFGTSSLASSFFKPDRSACIFSGASIPCMLHHFSARLYVQYCISFLLFDLCKGFRNWKLKNVTL